MDAASERQNNPLGLNIDFMFGRGYLWAKNTRLSDWITLESLRMEIPDLQFPFDARGGLHRFRHTRCLVREIELSVSEAGLQELLHRAAQDVEGFKSLKIRFLEDAIHVSVRLHFFGADTYLSFRVALIPPEPARADELHISLYDYRAFGPLPYPARLLAYELVTTMLGTPTLRPPGRGKSFTVGIAGDIMSLRPLKLMLLQLFPSVGWKLPNLSGVLLDGAKIRPGRVTLRASGRDDAWYTIQQDQFHLSASAEGARALAAYEAKDLFSHADEAIFAGEFDQALALLHTFRDVYGAHPELNARAFDCFLANPTAQNLAEAGALLQELARDQVDELHHALAAPTMAILSKQRPAKIVEAFAHLSNLLKQRNELDDWILSELSIVEYIQEEEPHQAIERLREILKVSPRNKQTLQRLHLLYERTGDYAGFEEVLKRLTGIYTDRETLKETYLTLANHLIDRRGQLNEARLYLERVLRLNPTQQDALFTLGESYVLGDEPLRAIKAFGSAARAAQSEERFGLAASLHSRIARIWHEALNQNSEALLSSRRALQLLDQLKKDSKEYKDQWLEAMEQMATLAQLTDRQDEALSCWQEVVGQLESLLDQSNTSASTGAWANPALAGANTLTTHNSDPEPLVARLIKAHEHLGQLYTDRNRPEAAAAHWKRVLELNPDAILATQRLEQDLRQRGRPEELIAFYRERIALYSEDASKLDILMKLAQVYEQMGMIEEAQIHLQEALRIEPRHTLARTRLIDILRGAGRFETLRHALQTTLLRLTDRNIRHDILMVLAPMQLNQLKQPRQSARSYFEALDNRASDRLALQGARLALETIIHNEGVMAPAPVGSDAVGRLQEKVLLKLADITLDPREQVQLLDEVITLAQHRQDNDAIDEAKRRIQGLEERLQQDQEIDHRIDTLLDIPKNKDTTAVFLNKYLKNQNKVETSTTPLHKDNTAPVKTNEEAPSALIPSGLNAQEATVAMEDQDDVNTASDKPKPSLTNFRNKLQRALTQPSKVEHDSEDMPWQDLLNKSTINTSEPQTNKPPEIEVKQAGLTGLSDALDDAWDSLAQMSKIDEARQSDNPENLVNEIETTLQQGPLDNHPYLKRRQYLALARELGELLYYDLEQNTRARTYLELVREHDPEANGQSPSLLNALEAIYEETGQFDARLKLLSARMENSQSQEMATTYRLLLAQLLWDEQEDAKTAKQHLQVILRSAPKHEAAHRLLAKIASDQGLWPEAVKHYDMVLQERVGGLDEVELERELADIYLNHLKQPLKARKHYEGVLEASPADAQALEGIKQSQAMLADWSGYIQSLGLELGLLLGSINAIDLKAPDKILVETVSTPLRTAASQIVSDAAQIAQEELKDKTLAHALWGLAYSLWPDQIEALEARIELGRAIQADVLPEDLENFAALLIEPNAQFDVLFEAAQLYLNDPSTMEKARTTLAEAIAVAQDQTPPHRKLEEARRLLHSL